MENLEVRTKHQYIDNFTYKSNDKYLILGTIHPHKVDNFKLDFFYGNKNTLWSIIEKATNIPLSNKDNILDLLIQNNIWISDMISKCSRKKDDVTADKELFALELNDQIREGLENSEIEKIFFTSAFEKNNAAKLFIDNFNIEYKSTYDEEIREFIIPKDIFGREIIGVVLFSPSNQANRGISNNKVFLSQKKQLGNENLKVNEFKVNFYRKKFHFLKY